MNATSPHLLHSPYADAPRGKREGLATIAVLVGAVVMLSLPWLLRVVGH
jgi:hypothetical protein